MGPFIEPTYLGSNGVYYKHIYYLAKAKDSITDEYIDPNNRLQLLEIGNIKWVSFNELMEMIRPQYMNKKKLLKEVNEYIISIEHNDK